METQTVEQLTQQEVRAVRRRRAEVYAREASRQLTKLAGWRLTHDGQRIRKDWVVKNFMAGIDFFQRVAEVAEDDGHHPDLHLEGYRNVVDRALHARHRRPVGERFHPGGQDRPVAHRVEEVTRDPICQEPPRIVSHVEPPQACAADLS